MKVGDLVRMNVHDDYLPEPGWDMWGIGTVVYIECEGKRYESVAEVPEQSTSFMAPEVDVIVMWSKLDRLGSETPSMLRTIE